VNKTDSIVRTLQAHSFFTALDECYDEVTGVTATDLQNKD